ncbi:hypothetical protein F9L07_22710 [Pimelobacter simplex]|uniref:Uncharacterized protein n=1 Tax=Nocardioides simplex TaxID=2045 RepID=A0A7J5DT44_NOCSI|nr:hypothetical protein [Pimelobacter simplex]KAB2808330.1 hypothetical protein F9L07_22710 [Pimelobacter simplex]
MSRPLFGTPIAQPFRWFAWHPVHTGDRGWRWLRPVWRQRYQTKVHLPGPIHQWWHHDVERDGGDHG